MNRINEFKPCPICDKSDRLDFGEERSYNKLFRYRGETGCTGIRCDRCKLELFAHSHEANNTWNYQILVGKLKEKWNGIKR